MKDSLHQLSEQVLEVLNERSPVESISVFRLNENAVLPTRANPTDAGLDLYAIEDVFIPVNKTQVVKTGVAIKIPDGYVGKVEDRSSMAVKGLRTGAGVIDSGYTGEVGVVIHNLNNDAEPGWYSSRGFYIKRGQKIAQLLLYKVETPKVEEVSILWSSERGSGGFGSSGA